VRLHGMDEHPEHPDDAVEVPGRRSASLADAHVADALRRAVASPAPTTGRAHQLTQAALRRTRQRRHRRLLTGSAALTAAVTLTAFGVSAAAPWAPRPADNFAANTGPAPTASASPSFTMAPMPTATEQPASPLEYLTLDEVRSVFPGVVMTEGDGTNDDFQWFDVAGHTWFTACVGDTVLEGIAPLYSMQGASWGTLTPQSPEPGTGYVYTRRDDQVGFNVFIFRTAAEATVYGEAYGASVSTCVDDPAVKRDPLALDPSRPVAGTLDTGAASLSTYGYHDGAWSIDAVVVRGRYAVRATSAVPTPETEQGYVDAARATAGLATIAAERAAAANLP